VYVDRRAGGDGAVGQAAGELSSEFTNTVRLRTPFACEHRSLANTVRFRTPFASAKWIAVASTVAGTVSRMAGDATGVEVPAALVASTSTAPYWPAKDPA
jgi:hypothetical protein